MYLKNGHGSKILFTFLIHVVILNALNAVDMEIMNIQLKGNYRTYFILL